MPTPRVRQILTTALVKIGAALQRRSTRGCEACLATHLRALSWSWGSLRGLQSAPRTLFGSRPPRAAFQRPAGVRSGCCRTAHRGASSPVFRATPTMGFSSPSEISRGRGIVHSPWLGSRSAKHACLSWALGPYDTLSGRWLRSMTEVPPRSAPCAGFGYPLHDFHRRPYRRRRGVTSHPAPLAPERPWGSPFRAFSSPRSASLSGAPCLLDVRCAGAARSKQSCAPQVRRHSRLQGVDPATNSYCRQRQWAPAADALLGFVPPESSPLRSGTGFHRGHLPSHPRAGQRFIPPGSQGLSIRRSRSTRLRAAISLGVLGLVTIAVLRMLLVLSAGSSDTGTCRHGLGGNRPHDMQQCATPKRTKRSNETRGRYPVPVPGGQRSWTFSVRQGLQCQRTACRQRRARRGEMQARDQTLCAPVEFSQWRIRMRGPQQLGCWRWSGAPIHKAREQTMGIADPNRNVENRGESCISH